MFTFLRTRFMMTHVPFFFYRQKIKGISSPLFLVFRFSHWHFHPGIFGERDRTVLGFGWDLDGFWLFALFETHKKFLLPK